MAVSDDPTDKTRDFDIVGDDFYIPFDMSGTTVLFTSRVPTQWEMENSRIVELTLDVPWNPSQVTIASVTPLANETLEVATHRTVFALDNVPRFDDVDCTCYYSDLSVYEPTRMLQRMVSSVQVATAHRNDYTIAYVGAKHRHSRITPETVAKKFRCGLETAQRTVKTTTQRGVRHAIHPLHR